MKRLIKIGECCILCFFILSGCAFAFQFNVDTPRVELTINRGEKKNSYITVSNTHPEEAIHIKVYVQDLVYLPDGSNDFLPPGTTPWSCAEWIKLIPDEFDLRPNREQVVKFQARVPPEARGGYYAVIFFEVLSTPEQQEDLTTAAVAVRIGTIVLVDVAGTAEYKAKLTGLTVATTEKEDVSILELTCSIKNLGNLLIRPKGTIQILDSQKTEQATLDLNPSKGGILPGTTRNFTVSLNEPLSEGRYTVRTLVDYGGDNLLGGQTSFDVNLDR